MTGSHGSTTTTEVRTAADETCSTPHVVPRELHRPTLQEALSASLSSTFIGV